MRQYLKNSLYLGIALMSVLSLEANLGHTVSCPAFFDDPSTAGKRHSFLGAKLDRNYYRCFYGVGFVSTEIKLDAGTRDCRPAMPRKNPVGIRNLPDCLGSAEDCQLICR